MQVRSARFGDVQVGEKSVITFPNGIPGFDDNHRYVVMRCAQTDPIQWMQSVDDEYVILPVINPFLLMEEYHVEVSDEELDVINTRSEEDIIVLCVMVLTDELPEMTANLMSPILINVKDMLGCQVVMDYADMPLKFPAFEPLLAYYAREEGGADAGSDEKAE